jgi:hypothetical protein
MPLIFRAMLIDGDFPRCGDDAKCLGVRVPPSKTIDIEPDAQGHVHPRTGGMSVAPSPLELPFFRVPKRLKGVIPGATGSDDYACWHLGEGPFVEGEVADSLVLRPDSERAAEHGFVEPAARMRCLDYQAALAATREHWRRWEGDP